MKLKNMLLTATTPFLLSCNNPTAPETRLQLVDYACLDDSCEKLGKVISQDEPTRPLRFVSIARYPGIQNYRWEFRWSQKINYNGHPYSVNQYVWVEADNQKDFAMATWDLRDSPKVEYNIKIKVNNDSIMRNWQPVKESARDQGKVYEIPLK